MNCIRCGLRAGYNRVVVDVLSGVELGGLCVDCEHTEFGESLAKGYWSDADGCRFCDRDGHFALARWDPQTNERAGDVYCSVEYEITDATVHVCDEHLHALREDAAARGQRHAVRTRETR